MPSLLATLRSAPHQSDGTSRCSTSTSTNLAVGSYDVTATYSGDNTFQGSTASTHFTINKAPTRFSASVRPARVGSGQTFTITINGLPANATGLINITVGNTQVCSISVTGGTCSLVNSGRNTNVTLTATYAGDANYLGSSATFRVTIA